MDQLSRADVSLWVIGAKVLGFDAVLKRTQ